MHHSHSPDESENKQLATRSDSVSSAKNFLQLPPGHVIHLNNNKVSCRNKGWYQTGSVYKQQSSGEYQVVGEVGVKKTFSTSSYQLSPKAQQVAGIFRIISPANSRYRYVIMYHYGQKTLKEIMSQCLESGNEKLTLLNFRNIFLSLLLEIRRIHESNLVHLDINPKNIRVDANYICRLIDFEGSAEIQNGSFLTAATRKFCYTVGYIPSDFFADRQNYLLTKADDFFAARMTLMMLFACVENPMDPRLNNYYRSVMTTQTIENIPPNLARSPIRTQSTRPPVTHTLISPFIEEYLRTLKYYLKSLMDLPNSVKKIHFLKDFLMQLGSHFNSLNQLVSLNPSSYLSYADLLIKVRETQFFALDFTRKIENVDEFTDFYWENIGLWPEYSCQEESPLKIPALRLSDLTYLIISEKAPLIRAEQLVNLMSCLIRQIQHLFENNFVLFDLSPISILVNQNLNYVELVRPPRTIKYFSHFAQIEQELQADNLSKTNLEMKHSHYFTLIRLIFDLLGYTDRQDCIELRKIYKILISIIQPSANSDSFTLFEDDFQSSELSFSDLKKKLIDSLLLSLCGYYSELLNSEDPISTGDPSELFYIFIGYMNQINLELKFESNLFISVLVLLFNTEERLNEEFDDRGSISLFIQLINYLNTQPQRDKIATAFKTYLNLVFLYAHSFDAVQELLTYYTPNQNEAQKILCQFIREKLEIVNTNLHSCQMKYPRFSQEFAEIAQLVSTLFAQFDASNIHSQHLPILYECVRKTTESTNTLLTNPPTTAPGTLFYPFQLVAQQQLQLIHALLLGVVQRDQLFTMIPVP